MRYVSRHQFLASPAVTGVRGAVPSLLNPTHPARAAAASTIRVDTRVIEVKARAATVFGLIQPDGTHGLVTQAGQRFRVGLENRLDEETLMHWHGLTLPWQQDGVPHLYQPPLAPGATYDYDFPLDRPGTNWMHSHHGRFPAKSVRCSQMIKRRRLAAENEKETSVPRHKLQHYLLIVMIALTISLAPAAEARYTVPIESLWHIQGVEITSDTPWRLYLPTHQGVFLVGPEGIAERISAKSEDFRSFSKHPRFSGVFYAGVSTPSGINRGLMKSNDGAKTWMRLSGVAEPPVAFDRLTISLADPRVLYGVHLGLYVSRDGGRSWSERPTLNTRIFAVAASSIDPDVVYVATAEGVTRSFDAGENWQPTQLTKNAATMVHMTPHGTIYAYDVGYGLMRATEPSFDWTLVHRRFERYVLLHLAVDPADASRLFAVTDNSEVLASEDGGLSWTHLHSRYAASPH